MSDEALATQIGNRFRPWILGAGVLLTAVSGAYLVLYALKHEAELRAVQIGPRDMAWAATGCALYCGALMFTGLGWLGAVRAFGGVTRGPLVVCIALISQIGKYAPGNVAQHIGRVVFATSRGMPLRLVTKSILLELVSAVLACGLVAVVTGAMSFHQADPVLAGLAANLPGPIVAILAGIGLLIVGLVVVPRVIGRHATPALALPPVAATLFAHVLSAALAGLSFYAVVRMFAGPDGGPLYCVALFSVAWLAGFLTPGAPAGLGVRETILLLGLSGVLGPLSLPAALMHRLVSAIADGLMAVVAVISLRLSIVSGDQAS